MIFDVHTYLWERPEQWGDGMARRLRRLVTPPWDRPGASRQEHDRAVAEVDGALVLGFQSRHMNAHVPAELIADHVARNAHRLIGLAGIDPSDDGWSDRLDRALSLGLAGVVVSPAAQAVHPGDDGFLDLMARCENQRLPVVVLPGASLGPAAVLSFGQPMLLDETARAFPKLRIVVGELGDPWIDQTLTLLERHEHVHADTAAVVGRPWQLYDALARAAECGVTDKLLLGSGFPFCSPGQAVRRLYAVERTSRGTGLPVVPRALIEGIVTRDALALLGLAGRLKPAPEPVAQED